MKTKNVLTDKKKALAKEKIAKVKKPVETEGDKELNSRLRPLTPGRSFSQIAGANDPIPIYYKLQQELKQQIESGYWAPGEPIPSSRTIAQSYNVSMGTVRKAIDSLAKENYLYCLQGKGTFVTTTRIKQESLRYYLFREGFDGNDPEYKIQLIGFDTIRATRSISHWLQTHSDEKVYRLRRNFIENEIPIIYNVSYLPCKMFKNFKDLVLKYLERETLYELIERAYGLPTIYNQELFSVGSSTKQVAQILKIAAGEPVLEVEMLSFTYKNQPYEYRISYLPKNKRKIYRELR